MSDWKNVQYKDGKMRTSEGGGVVAHPPLLDLMMFSFKIYRMVKCQSIIPPHRNGKMLTRVVEAATIDVSSLNIDIPLGADIFGRCTLNGTDFTLGSYFQDNNDGINCYLQSNKTTLVVRSRSNYPRGENMYVVLRYTKTTD